MFNAAIRETPSSNEGAQKSRYREFLKDATHLKLQMGPQGLTALEMWCLAMIGLVFVTLIAYGIILVQLNVTKNKRHWRLELSMFLILVFVTIIFVIYFFVHSL